MKIGLFLFFAFLAGGVKAQSDEVSLERALYDLPDLAFKKVSTASDPDLKYELTIRQPLDHLHPEKGYFYHAINQLFRKNYKGKWISTGISKGGETTLYYKYFYPGDVDLSVPYVAPPGGAGLHFSYTGSIGKSFEYAVLEFPFAFWQYNGQCDSLPSGNNLDDYVESLIKVSDLSGFADEGIKPYEAHYYQVATQSGY